MRYLISNVSDSNLSTSENGVAILFRFSEIKLYLLKKGPTEAGPNFLLIGTYFFFDGGVRVSITVVF